MHLYSLSASAISCSYCIIGRQSTVLYFISFHQLHLFHPFHRLTFIRFLLLLSIWIRKKSILSFPWRMMSQRTLWRREARITLITGWSETWTTVVWPKLCRDADISAKNPKFREFITNKLLGITERDKQHMVQFLLYFHSDF